MSSAVTLVIFEGGIVESELEETFRQVRKAVVIDQIIKAQKAGFDRIVLLTSYRDLIEAVSSFSIETEYQPQVAEEFHFGENLLKIIRNKQLTNVLYMGGAAAPLISSQELSYIRTLLEKHSGVVTANNYYSADIVGFNPGVALENIVLPPIDNMLPSILVNQAGLKFIPLMRTLGMQFDLDTPAELLVLASHPEVGFYTKSAIANTNFDLSVCNQIKQILKEPQADLVVFGRVSSQIFKLLDELTHCRIRLYSEERGLKSLGRDKRGEVKSLIAEAVRALGYHEFFNFLSQICRGAVLDTRIMFSHFNWNVSQSDRFYSDLGQVDKITHSGLKEFTQAACQAAIPVMCGGHSLVTGGLWALIEASYLEYEAANACL
ncbi:MAG: hypothetical protein GX994_01705 [Firmicutes bacterium]|nr:hypothetical protein [Bacillota bacterium]